MKSIAKLIVVLASIYFGAPEAVKWIDYHVKKTCLEQISKKRTPLTEISRGLTNK